MTVGSILLQQTHIYGPHIPIHRYVSLLNAAQSANTNDLIRIINFALMINLLLSQSKFVRDCTPLSVCECLLPKVLPVPHVPGCGVADHLASIIRLHQHGVFPEVRQHLVKVHRHEELLCFQEKPSLIPALKLKLTCCQFHVRVSVLLVGFLYHSIIMYLCHHSFADINICFLWVGGWQRVQVCPESSPHVTWTNNVKKKWVVHTNMFILRVVKINTNK